MSKSHIQLLCLLIILFHHACFAFDDVNTHPRISSNAINLSNLNDILAIQLGRSDVDEELGVPTGEKNKISKWITDGSALEDTPKCRAANHFHNPLKDWKLSGLSDSSFNADAWCTLSNSPFKTKYSNIIWATGMQDSQQTPYTPAVNNNIAEDNGRNWNVARDQFYLALTELMKPSREEYLARTFETLGYILHLLQDMAVPAHTRNDFSQGHFQWVDIPTPDGDYRPFVDWYGNPFEGFVRNNYDTITEHPNSKVVRYVGESKLTNFWDTADTNQEGATIIKFDGQDLGLAEYSNLNFLSLATIFKDSTDKEHYFKYPSREMIIDPYYPDKINVKLYKDLVAKDGELDTGVYVTKRSGQGHEIEKFLSLRYITSGKDSLFDSTISTASEEVYSLLFKLDDECYLEYATHLIPRAVGYSSSLIDYFFRGKLDVEFKNGQVAITNRSDESMEKGSFELYYDSPEGVRTAITPLSNSTIDEYAPLEPNDTQTITFTMPDDFYNCDTGTKLTVVYRGKLGDELGAIAAKIVDVNPGCIVIKAGDNAGTHFFTVWNPVANAVAEITNPVTGTPITFPAEYAEIKNWLEERATTASNPVYTWETANSTLKRIGEYWGNVDICSCEVDPYLETTCNDYKEQASFEHPGCGSFTSYCNYTQTLSYDDNGKPVWDTFSERKVYVDREFQTNILGSYAPIVNTTAGKGEAACIRSEWYQWQDDHSYWTDGSAVPRDAWEISQPITWITPIGEMEPSESYHATDDYYYNYYCPSTADWSRWHRDPPYSGLPIAKPIINANYSDSVMVQLYFVSNVHWSGNRRQEPFIVNNTRECRDTSYDETFTTENNLVAACTFKPDVSTVLDPRTQQRSTEFEDEILSLVEHTISVQKSYGEISQEEVFKGGIHVYIASKDSSDMAGLLTLINETRALLGLDPLLPDNTLNNLAQSHVKDMARNQFMSHTGSDGKTFQERVNAIGYTNLVYPFGAQVGATQYVSRGYQTVEDLYNSFVQSLSWDTIMNAGYNEMGLASEIGIDGQRYWCLTFGFNDEH